MFTKRRIRFSIAGMLVVMTGVAMLLAHEVPRAKAIETTVMRIEEWNGFVHFRRHEKVPRFLTTVLPQFWTQEIDEVGVSLYTSQWPIPSGVNQKVAHIDPSELRKVLELGAMDNLRTAFLMGTAIDYDVISRICMSPSMEACTLIDVWLSKEEANNLEQSFSHCNIDILSYRERGSNELRLRGIDDLPIEDFEQINK